jgi:hypothetical protein
VAPYIEISVIKNFRLTFDEALIVSKIERNLVGSKLIRIGYFQECQVFLSENGSTWLNPFQLHYEGFDRKSWGFTELINKFARHWIDRKIS